MNKSFWPVVAIIALVIGISFLVFNNKADAAHLVAPSCGNSFTYHNIGSNVTNDSWSGSPAFNVGFANVSGEDGDPNTVKVTQKSGFTVEKVWVDMDGDDEEQVYPINGGYGLMVLGSTFNPNPPGSNHEEIDTVDIQVKADPCEPEPTPEEECELVGDFWNGESCEEIAVCEEGEHYEAETNQCFPDEGDEGGGETPSETPQNDPQEQDNGGGGSINYKCPDGSKTPYSHKKGGCEPANGGTTFGSTLQPVCFYLNALSTSGANYCPAHPSWELLWQNVAWRNALLDLYQKYGK